MAPALAPALPSPVSPGWARGPRWGARPGGGHKWRRRPQKGSWWGLAEKVRGSWGRSRWRGGQAAIQQGMGRLQTIEAGSSHGPWSSQLLACLIEARRPCKTRGPCQPGWLQEARAALRGARTQEGGWPGPLKQQVEALGPSSSGSGSGSCGSGSGSGSSLLLPFLLHPHRLLGWSGPFLSSPGLGGGRRHSQLGP